MLTDAETAREVAKALGRDPESRATARLAADIERFETPPLRMPQPKEPDYSDSELTDWERNRS